MTPIIQPTIEKFFFIQEGIREIFGSEVAKKLQEGEKRGLTKDNQVYLLWNDEVAIKGMLVRAGRASFYYWMQSFGPGLGWREPNFRLLPSHARSHQALVDLLNWMDAVKFLKTSLTESSDSWQLMVTGLFTSESIIDCNFFLGMLQELLSWAGGGKFFIVRETKCQGEEDLFCEFVLNKNPLG
ncbi:MAG: hypothetical protein NTZ74_05445 [Chloroflexi bacterium]|nr:hypothetical protein [Chloroflexota bacterium]